MWLSIPHTPRPSPGFTLMEVLVATLLMLIVTGALFSAYRYQMFALKGQEEQLATQQTGRSLVDLITREVRLAGYDPTCTKSFAGIADARAQWLQVQFDRNGDGVIGAGERITYSYNADRQEIGRDAGGGTVSLVSGVPQNALTFTYYDGTGAALLPTGTPPALTSAQRTAVRRVRVLLHLERPNPDPLNASAVVSDQVGNVDLRNRFLNSAVACP